MNIDDRMEEAGRPEDPAARVSNHRDYEWSWDKDEGRWIMPDLQRKFLEEYCMVWPRPCTQVEWAKEHGIHSVSLTRWKRDPRFVNEFHRLADQSHAHPDFWKPVIERLRDTALANPEEEMNNTQVKAARDFFHILKQITPTEPAEQEVVDPRLNEILDAETAAIAEGAFDDASSS